MQNTNPPIQQQAIEVLQEKSHRNHRRRDSPGWSVASAAVPLSSHLSASFSLLGDLVAQNEAFEDACDGIKLCGVYERIGADIEKLRLIVDDNDDNDW